MISFILLLFSWTNPGEYEVTFGASIPEETGYNKHKLISKNGERNPPIALGQSDPVTWNLVIRSKLPLTPGLEEANWSDAFNTFNWKASGGNILQVSFSQSGKEAYWSLGNLQTGLDYWETFRGKYNSFRRNALFYTQ